MIKIAFFVFLLPFFEAFGENKWCLQIRYFRRETYALQNAVFGSLFVSQEIFEQKASKTRFFYFIIFDFLMRFLRQNYEIFFLYNSNEKMNECAIDQDFFFCVFVAPFWDSCWK